MAPHRFSALRFVLAAGFAAAVLAAPAVAAFATTDASTPSIAACPAGESEDTFTTICVPDMVPNSPDVASPSESVGSIPGNPDLPEVGGIPCTGGNSGQCIGLSEDQAAAGPQPVPRSTVSSSP